MTIHGTLGATLLFIQGGFVLNALVGSYQVSHTGNLTSFLLEMDMSPTLIITGQRLDLRMDHIIRTISRQGKTVILDLDAFPSTIASHVSAVMLYENLESVKRNLKFLVLADIGSIRPLLLKAQQLDTELGSGLLLRHFSRWLVLLTTGQVDTLTIDNIVLDNVAITTLDNISDSQCKTISFLQTMMWKNTSRQLQHVSQVPTGDLSSRVFPNTKTGLNGRVLKVATLSWFTCKVNSNTTTFSGPCDKLMSHLSEVFNFSYTYAEPEDQSWGIYDNGTWGGIIGLLVNKTADISAVPYAATLLRANYLAFLFPIRYTHVDILYKKPDSAVDLTGLLSCFKWQIYVCVLAILVGVTTFFLMSKRPSVHHTGRSKLDGHQTLETIMLTVGVICNQGSSTLPATVSNRTLLAFWWLCCIPITAVYCGNLVAFLTVTKDIVPLTGLDDLLDSGYDIGIETGTYFAETLSRSNDYVYQEIWKKNREHQPDNLTIYEDRMYHRTRLPEGRYAFIASMFTINRYMMETCDMAHTKERLFQSMASLIAPKHSPLALLMDPELMFLMERGFIDKWYGQSYQDEKMCSSEVVGDEGLELMDLFTVLLVAGCGVGLAAVVLGFEICRYKMLSYMKQSIEVKDL